MKLRYVTYLMAAVLLVSSAGLTATAAEDYDNTAAIFEVGAGARTLGMGRAFIGLADDENAALYNPAGLAFLEGSGINTSHSSKFNPLTYNSGVGALGPFGIMGANLSSGMFDVTNEDGEPTGGQTSYSSTGLVGGFGVSGDIVGLGSGLKNMGIGLQLRTFHSNLYETQGSGFSLSFSSLYRMNVGKQSKLQVGVIVPSILLGQTTQPGFPFGNITYKDSSGDVVHEEPFPNNFGLGIGVFTCGFSGQELNVAVDWRAEGGFRAGLEHLFPLGAVRFGATGTGSLTAGAGLRIGRRGSVNFLDQIGIDGAYRWQPGLGSSFTLSFSVKI